MRLRNISILLAMLLVALAAAYVFARPQPPAGPPPVDYVWRVDRDDITKVELRLPRENAVQKFIKISQGDRFPWFFDDSERTPVDQVRWSGAIPLLLSGPAAQRIVNEDPSAAEMAAFGLDRPQLEITLTMGDGQTLLIAVGDETPDGGRSYVRSPGSRVVATVDVSWYETISQLVRKPPYVPG